MPSLVINNTAQIRLIWQINGTDYAVNVLHGIKDDPLGGIDQARADGIATNITNALNGMVAGTANSFATSWTLARVGVRDLDSANNPEFLGTVADPWNGTGAAEYLPLNVASCVTLRTDRAGASYRGRCYVSGWVEGASSGGVMATSAQTAAVRLVEAVRDGMDASGFTLAVASRALGQSRPVQSIVSRDQRWDTQRRRIIPGI